MTDKNAVPQNLLGRLFYRWAEACYDHGKWIVVLSLVMLGGLISQLPKLHMDMSVEAMLHELDPVRVNYDEFKEVFGRDDVVILSLPTGGVLSDKLLKTLSTLQARIETDVPYVHEVTSLINARHTYGDNDLLVVEDLLDGWPQHKWDNRELTDYVLGQESYRNRLISADGSHTAILVELEAFADATHTVKLDEKQSAEAIKAIRKMTDEYPEMDIAMAGRPVINNIKNVITLRDSGISTSVSLGLTLLFLIFFFRRISGVLLPMLVIYGSIIGAAGMMAIFGSPFTLTISAVFPLMVAVGVADSVHILAQFYRNYEGHGNKRSAIIGAISHSAPAVLMTSLTTAAGFISFVAGELASTAELGIYAAVAVMFALFFTIALLPALLSIFRIRQQVGNRSLNHKMYGFLDACGRLAYTYPRAISIISIVTLLLCVWGCSILRFSYDPISQFPDSIVEKRDNYAVDATYAGNSAVEVVIDTGTPNGIYEPAFIQQLQLAADQLAHSKMGGIEISETYSVLNILKETHRALNGNNDAFYRVADTRDLLAQETLLFEMSNHDDLMDVVNDNYSAVRLTLKCRYDDGVKYQLLVRELEKRLHRLFPNDKVTVTGSSVLSAESVPRALSTMAKSYVLAAVMIIGMMMLTVRSVRIGLVSILPNLLPIMLVLNIMVLMHWPLDMATIMFAAIAMGVVVDDTLHFLYNFKLSYRHSLNVRYAIQHTLRTTGPAMFITTVIFSAGSAANMLSSLDNIFAFGFSMWLVTILALLADILVAPAMLVWVYGHHKHDEDWVDDKAALAGS